MPIPFELKYNSFDLMIYFDFQINYHGILHFSDKCLHIIQLTI